MKPRNYDVITRFRNYVTTLVPTGKHAKIANLLLLQVSWSVPEGLVEGHNWFLNQFVEIPRRSIIVCFLPLSAKACLNLLSRDGWLSCLRTCLLREPSGFESRHLPKIQNKRSNQKSGQHIVALQFLFQSLNQSPLEISCSWPPYRISPKLTKRLLAGKVWFGDCQMVKTAIRSWDLACTCCYPAYGVTE
jgi:hypothetical protein